MKLSKQLETEVLEVYHAYWNSYLQGDMKTFASMLDDNCRIIGSTEFDVFNNKKDAVEFYTSTAEQITGKADFKNRKISLLLYDDNVMIQELSDFYFLADDAWQFYSNCRLSTLFSKKENGWKIIYQHGSMPDVRAQQEEQLAGEEIAKENKQLRDAVKRRTAELEYKNHELEIENALEKVRAIALLMKEPDDMLEICKTISQQLQSLGVKEIRNVQTAIFYTDKGTYMNYEYYTKHDKIFITETTYSNNEKHAEFAKNMQQGNGQFFELNINNDEIKDWVAYQKTTNIFIDEYLNTGNIIKLLLAFTGLRCIRHFNISAIK